jgi:hypothetical protein
MRHRTFIACALVVLMLELLALGSRPVGGPSTAELERIVADDLQVEAGPVSDVRCVRHRDDAARCVALMYDGSRTQVLADIDSETGRVASTVKH